MDIAFICMFVATCLTASIYQEAAAADYGGDTYVMTTEKDCHPTPTPTPALECPPKLELVFVMDSSCSIRPRHFYKMKRFIKNVVKRLNIGGDSIRVGLVKYSKYVKTAFGLIPPKTRDEILMSIYKCNRYGLKCGTNTGTAIKEAQNILDTEGRKNVARVMVVLTDGRSNKGPDPVIEAEAARTAGTTTVAVAIGKRIKQEEINGIAGDKSRVLYCNDFDALESIVEELAETICETCYWFCENGFELPCEGVCNNQTQCDETDESDRVCEDCVNYNKFACNEGGQKCIEPSRLCDNVTDCTDGTDEIPQNCNYWRRRFGITV